jgi:hypothetical protein
MPTKQPLAYDVLPHETIAGIARHQVLDAIVDAWLPQASISHSNVSSFSPSRDVHRCESGMAALRRFVTLNG